MTEVEETQWCVSVPTAAAGHSLVCLGFSAKGLETETLLASGEAAVPTLGELSVQEHNLCSKTK